MGRGRFKVSRELQLVRLTRRGFTPVRTLWRSDVEGPDTADRLRAVDDVAPGPIAELKSGELAASALDSSRIEQELGWRATIDVEQGLAQTLDWYRHGRR